MSTSDVRCPFCDLTYFSEEEAVRHAIEEGASHGVGGYHMAETVRGTGYPPMFYCWCSGPYQTLSALVDHMVCNGGYRLHAMSLLLGLEEITE